MGEVDPQYLQMFVSLINWWKMVWKEVELKKICLVQINFVVVELKQKCLGLHRMYVNNGIGDDIEIHEILIEVLGWEVYVVGCLLTIYIIEEYHLSKNHTFDIFVVNKFYCYKLEHFGPTTCGYWNEILYTWSSG